MSTTTILTTHRSAFWRALEAVRDALAQPLRAWQRRRDERLAQRAVDDALELPEHTLRDMGAPGWLIAQAQARREAARLDPERMRVRDRIASRGW